MEDIVRKIEQARLKYKPDKVKYLLIAEAPPKNIDRFFYYENVKRRDYLFMGVMKVLYPEEYLKYKAKRTEILKRNILQKFQSDKFYLMDVIETPCSGGLSVKMLRPYLPVLKQKIEGIINEETKIILIKATVYDAVYSYLVNAGVKNVVATKIPFPCCGQQKEFQDKFQALKEAGYR